MRYLSTRGAHPERDSAPTFSEILLAGLAPDGGLYVPQAYPRVSAADLWHWRTLPYAQLAQAVLGRFCDDLSPAVLRELTDRTYTAAHFQHQRDGLEPADITPLKLLGHEALPGHGAGQQGTAPLSLLELSNGPTLAFKDLAMQLLGNLFEHVLARDGGALNILGATSGDTGSAAEYAMRGKRGIRVFMLSPHGKMSAFQRAQMYSLRDPNIFNIAVDGVFDDCQDIVKAVSNDLDFKTHNKIGTVNSINWARIVAQVVYYFKGYLASLRLASGETLPQDLRDWPKVSFTVPSGNFGNVCAGHIARMMGLPIQRLVVATNENDVLDEFFKTGRYRVRSAEQTRQTSSPSMDISKASNFERFVFDLVGRDASRVAGLFADLERKGSFDLSGSEEFASLGARFGFVSGSSTHAERVATIQDIYGRYRTIIDTHTADGVAVARRYLEDGVPMIVLETAQPVKFAETIKEALGREPERPRVFDGIEAIEQHVSVLPNDVGAVKAFIAARCGA